MIPTTELRDASERQQMQTKNATNRPQRLQGPRFIDRVEQLWANSTERVRRVLRRPTPRDATSRDATPGSWPEALQAPVGSPRICAGAIVSSGPNALWVREPQNHFGHLWFTFAKGGLEPGESAPDAAAREVREETGLEVALLPGIFAKQARTTSHNLFYLAKAVGGDIRAFDAAETRCVVSMPIHWLPFYLNNQADRQLLWQLSTHDVAAAQGFCTRDQRPYLQDALIRADYHWEVGGSWDARFFATGQPEALSTPCVWSWNLLHTQHIEGILQVGLVDAHSTVVFDIDLTLIQSMASNDGQSRMTLPVEGPATLSTLRTLQERGVCVLGLTARHPREAPMVLDMLDSCGIDLSVTSPLEGLSAEGQGVAWPLHASYVGGVLFASDENAKGDMLALPQVRGRLPVHPETGVRRLLMVDDKPMNFYSIFAAGARVRAGGDPLAVACVLYDPSNLYQRGGGHQQAWTHLQRIWCDATQLQGAADAYQAAMSQRHAGQLQGADPVSYAPVP